MAMENSEFNKIMGKIEDVKDDLYTLQKRTDNGVSFVQSVSYAELDEIISRLDSLEKEALDYFELNSERYEMMTKRIISLREEVTHARTAKDHTSTR
ncbi:hypothetical protein IKF20_00085 [Candidatus Saccharibacteria bacterium]|nr:hypothetical protein [Candidatus Saccharibacteria bacterium]